MNSEVLPHSLPITFWRWVLACCFLLTALSTRAALDPQSPIGFFTNIASRLVRSELNLDLNHIQVYPTNQYGPGLHRLLQVTANVYDSTTNRADLSAYPYCPTIFRPLFRRDPDGTVFIAGYREVVDTAMTSVVTAPPWLDLSDPGHRDLIPLAGTPFAPTEQDEPIVSEIPLVIGAKKGFPAFNQFAMETAVTVSRRLRFRRTAPGQPVSRTNQIYSLAISNSFGVQAWNSYAATFDRPLTLIAVGSVHLILSNEFGVITSGAGNPLSTHLLAATSTSVPANSWTGFTQVTSPVSFKIPFLSQQRFMTNSDYVQTGTSNGTRFTHLIAWDPDNLFRVPQWHLFTRARVRFILVDTSANRIVDYVNLDETQPAHDLIAFAAQGGFSPVRNDPDPGELWLTNRIGNPTGQPEPDDPPRPTYGIWNQIMISLGARQVSGPFWTSFNSKSIDKLDAIQDFQEDMFYVQQDLDFESPFAPTRTFRLYTRWQANDPLVHHTVPDLVDRFVSRPVEWDSNNNSPVKILTQNPLAVHYRPWGGNPLNPIPTTPPTQFDTAVKDPLVGNSDSWNFPSGEPLTFETLGRIHRGTPWQTVYLKSTDCGTDTWMKWSGHASPLDAEVTKPIADRRLIRVLDPLLNTNHPLDRKSINLADTATWTAILDGLVVSINTDPETTAVISSNSLQAAAIAGGIAAARPASGIFPGIGALLTAPELSEGSPFINTNYLQSDFAAGINDLMLEAIPSQFLSRVRADSIGSAFRQNGQPTVRFTGYDGFSYALESSPDLFTWTRVSTNQPVDGIITFNADANGEATFYRSVLLR